MEIKPICVNDEIFKSISVRLVFCVFSVPASAKGLKEICHVYDHCTILFKSCWIISQFLAVLHVYPSLISSANLEIFRFESMSSMFMVKRICPRTEL